MHRLRSVMVVTARGRQHVSLVGLCLGAWLVAGFAQAQAPPNRQLPVVWVLATGGTISGGAQVRPA